MIVIPTQPHSVLVGRANGELPDDILVAVPGGRLIAPTARKWLALCGYAHEQLGVTLAPTSWVDTYRPLRVQATTFIDRYIPELSPGQQPAGTTTQRRVWRNTGWWKRTGKSTAAVPGTSNHGWGRAIDAGVLINGTIQYIATDPDGPGPLPSVLRWLDQGGWAVRCGFSWETIPEEPWHLRDVTGDTIPPAVLEWEASQRPQPPTPPPSPNPTIEDLDMAIIIDYAPDTPSWTAFELADTLRHITSGHTVNVLQRGGARRVTVSRDELFALIERGVRLTQPMPHTLAGDADLADAWLSRGGAPAR